MLNRQVAAEARLMAEMYCTMTRDAQVATLANMEAMSRTYPDLDRSVEVAQPLPRKYSLRVIRSLPGMPTTIGDKSSVQAALERSIPLFRFANYLKGIQDSSPHFKLMLTGIQYG